jgi:UDP-N-acetylmuramoyl-tripeptide--D-alanyl-D-alanine ligase
MEKLTIEEIARAVARSGSFAGEITESFDRFQKHPAGCLFVALAGERFNGHDYLADALKKRRPPLRLPMSAGLRVGTMCFM